MDNDGTATQEFIDDQMLHEIEDDEDEEDREADCGRWNNGKLMRSCRLAGTEWCDWECPIGTQAHHTE
jgi:hypothetical protein